jgi:hypothetical protein
METFFHTFYDIEIEPVPGGDEAHLIKILSIDGRRFTYRLDGHLDEEAVTYIKTVIDATVFADMIIERTTTGFEIRESPTRLQRHS